MEVRKISKTKWLCPFNKLVPCDDDCIAYSSRCELMEKTRCIAEALTTLANDTSPYDGGMVVMKGLEAVTNGLEGIADKLGNLDTTFFDTLGSSKTGDALDAIANLSDTMPDMSVVAESIDLLARVTNPTEYDLGQ